MLNVSVYCVISQLFMLMIHNNYTELLIYCFSKKWINRLADWYCIIIYGCSIVSVDWYWVSYINVLGWMNCLALRVDGCYMGLVVFIPDGLRCQTGYRYIWSMSVTHYCCCLQEWPTFSLSHELKWVRGRVNFEILYFDQCWGIMPAVTCNSFT